MKARKLLALALAGAMTFGAVSIPAAADDGHTLEVPVINKTGILRVDVPSAISIAFDMAELGTTGSNIHSPEFTMVNNSETDVVIKVKTQLDIREAEGQARMDLRETRQDAASAGVEEDGSSAAWIAVAARMKATGTDDVKYAENTSGAFSTIRQLDETSRNVKTFTRDDDENRRIGASPTPNTYQAYAEQTFYLAKPGTVGAYTYINEANAPSDMYDQYYALTKVDLTTGSPDNATKASKVNAELAGGHTVFFIGNSTTLTSGTSTFTNKLIAPVKAEDFATGKTHENNDFYSVALVPIVPGKDTWGGDSVEYVHMAAGTGSDSAAFKYIGELAEAKEDWTNALMPNAHLKYEIIVKANSKYTDLKTSLRGGYKYYNLISTGKEDDGQIVIPYTENVGNTTDLSNGGVTNKVGGINIMTTDATDPKKRWTNPIKPGDDDWGDITIDEDRKLIVIPEGMIRDAAESEELGDVDEVMVYIYDTDSKLIDSSKTYPDVGCTSKILKK